MRDVGNERFDTASAYLIGPTIGAHFAMYLAQMEEGSKLALPAPDVERFLFVTEGSASFSSDCADPEIIKLQVQDIHYNEHGCLLLEGKGICRLGDNWYPVKAGDAVWAAPLVSLWNAALGKNSSRYLVYKDTGNKNMI